MKDKLVIIGNGFDLAHNYNTSYKNFAQSARGQLFYKENKDLFANETDDATNWFEFEKKICDITAKLFASGEPIGNSGLFLGREFKSWSEYIEEVNKRFTDLSNKLMSYLAEEEKRDNAFLKTVAEYLNDTTYVIDFNYTSTVEKYTKDVFYVHGSIKENDIILGYDHHLNYYNGETDIMEPHLMRRNKHFMREALSYRRFLRKRGEAESKAVEEGNKYLDYIVNRESDMSGLIGPFEGYRYNEFVKSAENGFEIPIRIDFDAIKTIIIMGHSLSSDEMLLRNALIGQCTKAKHVVLFTYAEEKHFQLEEKERFLKSILPDVDCQTPFY